MKRKQLAIRIIALIMVGILSALLVPFNASAKQTYDFDVSLKIGYDNLPLVGYGAPFDITVQSNNTTNFEGYIQLIIPNFNSENVLYEQEITLGAGEVKNIEFIASMPIPAPFVNVRLTNKKHKVVWKELQDVKICKDKDSLRIGVLTDDFSALSYIDRHQLASSMMSNGNVYRYTTLLELNLDNFPTDYHALDMLDCILITDFSTDLLTQDQIRALNLWIQDGGLLIVGTGSTANKTLSGLNNKVFDSKISPTKNYSTNFGMDTWDYSYVSNIVAQSNNAYSSDECYQLYESYYDSDYAYKYFYDGDGDGYNDAVLEDYALAIDNQGNYYDRFSNKIGDSFKYLFEDSAFYQDPMSGEFHYKYYDQRYGVVDDTDPDFQDFISYISDYEIDNICMEEYAYLYGYDPKWYIYEYMGITYEDDINDVFNQYWGQDFDEFKKHQLYNYYLYEVYGIDNRPDLCSDGSFGTASDYSKINVDVAGIEMLNAEVEDEITADSSTDEFVLAQEIRMGNGYIVLCGVDFTKNPIPKTGYAGDLVVNLIEKYIGLDFVKEADDYNSKLSNSYYGSGYNYNNTLENFINRAGSAPIPPLLLYIGLLVAFLIASLVLYIVHLKKNKTRALWKIYPIMAILLSIMIYCLAFSTRAIRLTVNEFAFIFPDKVITKEEDYIVATVPKKKDYTVHFTEDVQVEKGFSYNNKGSYYTSSELDYDNYEIQYLNDYKHVSSVISNKVALESQEYKTESAYVTPGTLTITYQTDPTIGGTGPANIKITNNYSTRMEEIVVMVYDNNKGYVDYYFNGLDAGESVTLNSGKVIDDKNVTVYSYRKYTTEDMISHYTTHNMGNNITGFFFGELAGGFSKFLHRKRAMEYVANTYKVDSDHITVLAYPKLKIGTPSVESKKCKVNRTETIVVYKAYDDIKVK